jgi:hypothetical protein
MVVWGKGTAGRRWRLAAALFVVCAFSSEQISAQTPDPALNPPRPPAPIGPPAPSALVAPGAVVGPPTVVAPAVAAPPMAAPAAPAPPPPAPPAVQAAPVIPPGQVALTLSARFGRDPPQIPGALHWRVYADKPEPTGVFRLIKEDRTASPTFVLPPGGYVVDVNFGLANVAKRIQLRAETVREIFEIPAGGARFEGRVGDSRIPMGQISFDLFPGSQFELGDKRPVARDIATGEIVLVPEGTYYVVSNYGDGNAVVRSDIRVQPGKLTDVTINHRAAVITLKLVGERGGEALANTAWSVLTPSGDIIKESIGAFPRVILAEGDYVAIARNEGKVFNREFKVEPGFDREIEVLAK